MSINKLISSTAISRLNVNFLRTVLIVLSISLAMVCLILNSFISCIEDEANLIKFSNTDRNTVFVDTGNSNINYRNVDNLGNYFNGCEYDYFSKKDIGSLTIDSKHLLFEVLEVGFLRKKMLLPSFDQYGATEKTILLGGKLCDSNDFLLSKNTILIHESVGKFLFGLNSKIIGEKIKLTDKDCIYEVVGVLADTPDILRIINIIKNNNKVNIVNTYKIPFIMSAKQAENISQVLLFFEGNINISTLYDMRNRVEESQFKNLNITNMEEQINEITNTDINGNLITDISLKIVTIILCITSVVIIFFTIKERAVEIAVRKSFGATTIDILALFLSEIFICILIATCYSLPISVIIMVVISANISKHLFNIVFPLNFEMFTIPIVIISITVCLLAIVPILIYAKSKIVNCLKVS